MFDKLHRWWEKKTRWSRLRDERALERGMLVGTLSRLDNILFTFYGLLSSLALLVMHDITIGKYQIVPILIVFGFGATVKVAWIIAETFHLYDLEEVPDEMCVRIGTDYFNVFGKKLQFEGKDKERHIKYFSMLACDLGISPSNVSEMIGNASMEMTFPIDEEYKEKELEFKYLNEMFSMNTNIYHREIISGDVTAEQFYEKWIASVELFHAAYGMDED